MEGQLTRVAWNLNYSLDNKRAVTDQEEFTLNFRLNDVLLQVISYCP